MYEKNAAIKNRLSIFGEWHTAATARIIPNHVALVRYDNVRLFFWRNFV